MIRVRRGGGGGQVAHDPTLITVNSKNITFPRTTHVVGNAM